VNLKIINLPPKDDILPLEEMLTFTL